MPTQSSIKSSNSNQELWPSNVAGILGVILIEPLGAWSGIVAKAAVGSCSSSVAV